VGRAEKEKRIEEEGGTLVYIGKETLWEEWLKEEEAVFLTWHRMNGERGRGGGKKGERCFIVYQKKAY